MVIVEWCGGAISGVSGVLFGFEVAGSLAATCPSTLPTSGIFRFIRMGLEARKSPYSKGWLLPARIPLDLKSLDSELKVASLFMAAVGGEGQL